MNYFYKGMKLPPYIPLPKFLLQTELSLNAQMVYALLLGRSNISASEKNCDRWTDVGLPFNEKNIVDTVNNHVYTLQTELIEKTYDESAVAWSFVLAELQTDKYAEMIILYNEADVSDIAEKLEQFRQQRIVWMTDNTLKKNEIKIILEE